MSDTQGTKAPKTLTMDFKIRRPDAAEKSLKYKILRIIIILFPVLYFSYSLYSYIEYQNAISELEANITDANYKIQKLEAETRLNAITVAANGKTEEVKLDEDAKSNIEKLKSNLAHSLKKRRTSDADIVNGLLKASGAFGGVNITDLEIDFGAMEIGFNMACPGGAMINSVTGEFKKLAWAGRVFLTKQSSSGSRAAARVIIKIKEAELFE